MLAVDPGDKHVGMTWWWRYDDGRWEFRDAWHIGPENLSANIESNKWELIVYESFHMFPWVSGALSFSRMKTPELIGEIRVTARQNGCELVEQEPAIQKIIRMTPYYRDHVTEYGKPSNKHEESALCHGLYYIHMNPKGPNQH